MTNREKLRDQLDALGRQVRPAEAFTTEVLRRLTRIDEIERQGDAEAPEVSRAATGAGLGGRSGGARPIRWLWRAVASAAAVAAMLTLAAWLLLPDAPALAWDDVVEAMGHIRHFHVVAFNEDPRRADESRRLFKIELHYRAPDQWRGEGLGHVQFVHGDEVRLYSAEKRAFVDPAEARVRLIPPDFTSRLRDSDLLSAILASLFDGHPPEGRPVQSDVAAEAEGVEVFDYARDPTRQWARIWVLRQSRLPMRIKLFYPRSRDFMLVTFDYSDPQPASYFDPEHFARVVTERRLKKEYEILHAGAQPVGGMPTDPGHVHEMQGDYKAAQVVSTAGNADGLIMIESAVPGNVAARGTYIIHEGYETPTDNWGNVYRSTGGYTPCGGNRRRYYAPMPEFKHGEGQRVVTLRYAIYVQVPAVGKSYSHDLIYRVLKVEHVPVGLDTAGHAPEQEQVKYWSDEAITGARMGYLKDSAPAVVQWRHVEKQLAERPDDMGLLKWAYDLLNRHGRETKARELLEKKIAPAFLEDPVTHYMVGWPVSAYLREQARCNGAATLLPIAERLRKVWEEAQQNEDERHPTNARVLFYGVNSYFGWLLALPEKLPEFEAGAKPEPTDVVRGRDGRVVVRVRLPETPADRGKTHPFNIWPPPKLPTDRWRSVASRSDGDAHSYAWLLEPAGEATPAALTLEFLPYVVGRSGSGTYELQTPWTMTVPVPAGPTVDSAEAWWTEHLGELKTPEEQNKGQLVRDAWAAFEVGRYEEAAALFRQCLESPKDPQTNSDLDEYFRRTYRGKLLECRIRLGEMRVALDEVTAEEAALPPLDPTMEDAGALRKLLERRHGLRHIRLSAVRYLMERGRLDEASEVMERIAEGRPDPMRFHNHHMTVHKYHPETGEVIGGSSFTPRSLVENLWREFDTVAWDLSEQTESR